MDCSCCCCWNKSHHGRSPLPGRQGGPDALCGRIGRASLERERGILCPVVLAPGEAGWDLSDPASALL